MSKQYTVTVQFPSGIYAESRTREGITVLREGGYTGELTAEQLKAIKKDQYLTVVEAGAVTTSNTGEAEQIITDAKAKGEDIVKAAKDLAKDIVDKAKADAKATTDAAKTPAA